MYKNIVAYRVDENFNMDLPDAEDGLQKCVFTPCGATQRVSEGWIPPRGEENGPLIESVQGEWIIKMCVESKILPGSVVNDAVEEKCAAIEKNEGRKPGKKERREIKDEIILTLLPQAFTKRDHINAWYSKKLSMLFIDAGSIAKCDKLVTMLVEGWNGFGVSLINTKSSPQACMSHWLMTQEAPEGFSIDRETELKAADESKSKIKYSQHALDIEEIHEHIKHGKLPVSLAMTYDDSMSFMLGDNLIIKKITPLEHLFENRTSDDDVFDADMFLMTSEIGKLFPALIEALGGEFQTGVGEAVSEAASKGSGEEEDPPF